MMLPHLAARDSGMPLLIARAKLDVILAMLGTSIRVEPSTNLKKHTAAGSLRRLSEQPRIVAPVMYVIPQTLRRRDNTVQELADVTAHHTSNP